MERWFPDATEGAGMGSWILMGAEFQFCKMKGIVEMNGVDGCITM